MMIRSIVVVQQSQVAPVGSGKKTRRAHFGDDYRQVRITEANE